MSTAVRDIEDSVMARSASAKHSGNVDAYQVRPDNTFSIATAPTEKWNKILRRVQISEAVIEMDVYCPAIANSCKPGQFVIVRANERAERIPLTIADFDREAGTITMVIQGVGRSSKIINEIPQGARILDLVGPLGHPSEIENFGTVVLVAGGIGVAPVFPIQRALYNAGNHVITIFGARNKDLVFWEDKMRANSHEAYITTDDGSYGEKGFVTTVLQRLIDEGRKIDRCISIGPGIMMKNTCLVTAKEPVTEAAKATNCLPIPTIVSLNSLMVDGTGMCGGCRVIVGDHSAFVCVDGPEFDGHKVDWTNLARRMRAYAEDEKMEPSAVPKNAAAMRVPMPAQDPVYRSTNFFEVALGYTEEMAIAEASRCLSCPKPMCRKSCPVGINIPEFIYRITKRDYHGAYEVINHDNPCPGISGRVCPQETQCEGSCILGKVNKDPESVIAIGRLERFVADYVRNHPKPAEESTIEHTGCKVAIVGAGPGGIACASALASRGHKVTIFEALHAPGGATTYGVPSFRLPKDIVNYEVKNLLDLEDGALVDLRLNTPIGPCGSVPDLLANGYDAAFIGTGAGLPRFLGIPGEETPGVYSANEYLTRINLMRAYQFPDYSDTPIMRAKDIVVVGGGNVACDVARCARRLGSNVTMIYRRPLNKMPARAEEVHHAIEEGVVVKECFNPVEVVANCEGTGIKGVLAIAMNNTPDGKCIPIAGTEELVPCGLMVIAIGQGPNSIIFSGSGLKQKKLSAEEIETWRAERSEGKTDAPIGNPDLNCDRRGCILVDENNMTNLDGVFAAGDVVTGAATVIKALGAGKASGECIDAWLKKKNKGDMSIAGTPVRPGLPIREFSEEDVPELRFGATPAARKALKEVPPLKDASTHAIRIDLTDCCHCGACVNACNKQTIQALKLGPGNTPMLNGAVKLADTNCIGCGRCAAACPVGAITGTPAMENCLKEIHSGHSVAKVAIVAPSSKVGFFEIMHGVPGNGEEKMIAALRNLGFTHVYDIQAAADMTIIEETAEISERLAAGNAPVLTSCCPGWVKMINNEFPDFKSNLSTARSPQGMAVSVVRKGLSAKLGCQAKDIHITAVMPCTAKKHEIHKPELEGECQEVLTVRELGEYVQKNSISTTHENTKFDPLLSEATGAAVIFGATGGVMEAALRTIAHQQGVDWTGLNFTDIQGLEGVKEAQLTVGDLNLNIAVAHGGDSMRAVLRAMESGARSFDVVEGMACVGGCIGGGGQPRAMNETRIQERINVLRGIDTDLPKISSEENDHVLNIYETVIGKDAHALLHTTHTS